MVKKHSKKKNTPHRSFKRTYREGYLRETNIPGMAEHIVKSFRMIFKNWKIFLPFLLIMSVFCFLTIGTNIVFNETTWVFITIAILVIWLTTIYLVRRILAKKTVNLRDGLYNAMTPLISTFIVFIIVVLECIPIILVLVFYSAAIKTNFLNMPFYALLFFVFAALMFTISGYFLSSSLIAFLAVSAPGMYPLKALNLASELMAERRTKFIIRIIGLVFVVIIMWLAILTPFIFLDAWLKGIGWTVSLVTIISVVMGCFSCMYITIYLYLYYKWLLSN